MSVEGPDKAATATDASGDSEAARGGGDSETAGDADGAMDVDLAPADWDTAAAGPNAGQAKTSKLDATGETGGEVSSGAAGSLRPGGADPGGGDTLRAPAGDVMDLEPSPAIPPGSAAAADAGPAADRSGRAHEGSWMVPDGVDADAQVAEDGHKSEGAGRLGPAATEAEKAAQV